MTGRSPRATPLARYVAIIIGLALLATAIVCGREIWLRNSTSIHWDSWVEPIIMTIGDATYQPWMLPAGAVAGVLGTLLVWVALRPRTYTHRAVRSEASLWMRPVDISRLLSATARRVPGVTTAATRLSGSTAHVSVTGHRDDLAPLVDAALAHTVSALGLGLSVRVRQEVASE
ncbi:hypothetical protein SAMN06295981_1269 [Corynebacterium pollutisoli]|uniref:DUF6286 domain-containing protein n=1 Tax=Corynebacterium pollutisoli TaxID=1610489 RepID=A0A1X7J875_9CORY|nr:DUF6286 domain-containing protein [Corynebacterium pollutisoli]SMG23194.1 hypothetical protein SAMN06295981_1269 [Corynebacterium pollutisoli]